MNSPGSISSNIARGLAFFLGAYTLVGVAVNLVAPTFDPNLLWIDLRFAPLWLRGAFLFAIGGVLLLFGVTGRGNVLSRVVVFLFAIAAAINAVEVWLLLYRHAIASSIPFPISGLVCAGMIWLERTIARQRTRANWLLIASTSIACAVIFPCLQVFGFGKTEYRRDADVAVVFGARVYADGRLSDALRYRVRTAARLYREGRVRRLVMSGGPGNGSIHETDAMRVEAERLGVPSSAIDVDTGGLNTLASVRNTAGLARSSRVVAVSEFYHLPRIKMAYAAAGVNVTTAPADAAHWARKVAPMNVAREIPAFWFYYLRAVTAKA